MGVFITGNSFCVCNVILHVMKLHVMKLHVMKLHVMKLHVMKLHVMKLHVMKLHIIFISSHVMKFLMCMTSLILYNFSCNVILNLCVCMYIM
jgi:hypothetical protein